MGGWLLGVASPVLRAGGELGELVVQHGQVLVRGADRAYPPKPNQGSGAPRRSRRVRWLRTSISSFAGVRLDGHCNWRLVPDGGIARPGWAVRHLPQCAIGGPVDEHAPQRCRFGRRVTSTSPTTTAATLGTQKNTVGVIPDTTSSMPPSE